MYVCDGYVESEVRFVSELCSFLQNNKFQQNGKVDDDDVVNKVFTN